ncbi:MAG: UDP-N-acetylmuramoyl-L-alanyl-D-glutamate--2,6-diaminopimelate ligase [Acholeplasmataceae bacterium]|nr:UDP-N-acetylmuramoyl-L-alanyl-D-glutamate--2,6-diaminopimelate ligase [Acholeplasmataceae bacterium]
MDVKKIIKELKKHKIKGISDDTRFLRPEDCFVCRKGSKYEGANYIDEAVAKGAKLILTETEIKGSEIPVLKTTDIETDFPRLLSEFYDYPQRELRLIGITGTDGKTTTATIIDYLLSQKYSSSYIGTNGIRYCDHYEKTSYTTLPLALLIRTLRLMANKNIRYLTMEVSSQGLVNRRLDGLEFDVAVFTNLTHEHLDTHKTMDNYLQAKLQLFQMLDRKGVGIVNIDSPYGEFFRHSKLITYAIEKAADYRATNIRYQKKYTYFDLLTPKETHHDLKCNLTGKFNIYNVLAAIITAVHCNIPTQTIFKAIQSLPKIPGRMELLTTDEDFQVFVDFAHTPNALKEVLSSLRAETNRLVVVVGAAGGKDRSKRPEMGYVCTSIADWVIFTSEDPREEDPLSIIADLTKKVSSTNYEIIPDRKQAIHYAIAKAKPKDVIIITGKGNDDYYEEKGQIHSYSDSEEVLLALNKKREI